jgi:putative transposase
LRREALVRCEALIRPSDPFTVQQPRNLARILGERFVSIRFLIRDRGSNFTAAFDAVFQAAGTKILRTAVQTPRMNATCERLVGTLCRELPDRVLIPREAKLSRPVIPAVTYDGSLPASARRK